MENYFHFHSLFYSDLGLTILRQTLTPVMFQGKTWDAKKHFRGNLFHVLGLEDKDGAGSWRKGVCRGLMQNDKGEFTEPETERVLGFF